MPCSAAVFLAIFSPAHLMPSIRANWRSWCLLLTLCLIAPHLARADVLIGTNGERFVGKVIEETAESVVFESEIGGRLTLPRARIREIQRTTSGEVKAGAIPPAVAATNAPGNAQWVPPKAGTDGYDWIELSSGEWLKGRLKYIHDRKIKFESDKLEDLTFEWKDVLQIYTGEPMFAKFDGRDRLYGSIVVSNQMVRIDGPEQVTLPRTQLTGIAPGGERERTFWSGEAIVGLNVQAGNTKQVSLNINAELARRTPNTEFLVSYLSNYGEVNGVQNANNQRVDSHFDKFLNRNFFVRPMLFDYYADPLVNIKYRTTIGVGVGYYFLNQDRLKWLVAGGPGYQYTRFGTVEAGQSDNASTVAGVVETDFKVDITSRLKFQQTFGLSLTDEQSGRYSHHSVSTLEFEIKHYLDLNISFVWDYIHNPTPESDGTVPLRGDARLILGLGMKF